jgi:hypothetical protein
MAYMRDEDHRLIEQLQRQLLEVNRQLEFERTRRVAAERELDELHKHVAAIERRKGG